MRERFLTKVLDSWACVTEVIAICVLQPTLEAHMVHHKIYKF